MVQAASRGDEAARAEFASVYSAAIRGFFSARWRGRVLRAEAEDAAQEVLVECLKSDGVLERAEPGRGDFRGLLFGVSRNVARRFEERAMQLGRLLPEEENWRERVASDEAGQATLFDRSWARSMMKAAGKLHRERAQAEGESGQRLIEILVRRFQNNEEIREIAADWGVPAQEVHNAYRKARTDFHRCLREVIARHAPEGADLDQECQRLLELL